jgi:outer membrane protein assembly factor BamB
MRFITKFSWIFVIIFAGLIVYYSVILYDLLFRYPIPIPSRQITQNSLNLRELWRRNDVFLPGRSREKFSLLHATNSIIVFTNYNQNSSQSQLQVLDVESGQLVWEVSQPPRIRIHSLVVEDKYLYLAIDWQIQKYQISSGQLLWQTPGQPSERTGYRLVWLNKSLINYSTIVGESYFLMSVYNPITGVLMRQENIPIVPLLTTTQTEYQGDCRYLLAIDRPSGKVKWQTELGGCLDRQPVLTNSNLLVSTYTAFNSIAGLYLIDTNNGSV